MIIGRELEIQQLDTIFSSNKAEFLAVYGRRRVGKTFLIREFFSKKDCFFFYALGAQHARVSEQIYQFVRAIEETFYQTRIRLKEPATWAETFELLHQHLEQHNASKLVLFFDELPWLASQRSGFLAQLTYYWNKYWSTHSNIKLIVCGSAASWMIENIIHHRGGLYNRVTVKMLLEPFDLNETKQFLMAKKCKFTEVQIAELYMILGGVPYYLDFIDKKLSIPQNINHLCFHSKGQLLYEFQQLYTSLFAHAEYHEEIIRLLATKRKGMSKIELIEKSKLSSDGGTLTKRLRELEASGFIERFTPYGYKERNGYFRICDEFTLFYLTWIKPHLATLKRIKNVSDYWLEICQMPTFKSWAGYAFEALCFKHIDIIKRKLGIHASAFIGSWQYIPKKGSPEHGAQIDLLFDRHDDVITICEIKHTQHPYQLTKEEAKRLQTKIACFIHKTKTTKQIHTILITNHPIKSTMYSEEMIVQNVILKDLLTKLP